MYNIQCQFPPSQIISSSFPASCKTEKETATINPFGPVECLLCIEMVADINAGK